MIEVCGDLVRRELEKTNDILLKSPSCYKYLEEKKAKELASAFVKRDIFNYEGKYYSRLNRWFFMEVK